MTKCQEDRSVDWSRVRSKDPVASMRAAIVRYVGGYRGERTEPVTTAQIRRHFRATPIEFLQNALTDAVVRGEVVALQRNLRSGRLYNGVCVYNVAS